MLSMLFTISKFILKVTLIFAGILVALNLMSAKSSYQETFQKGTIPKQLPNGFYNGKVHTLSDIKTPWLGKSFDSKSQTGLNYFTPTGGKILKYITPFYKLSKTDETGSTLAYTFKTSTTKGLKDTNLDVITLDYNLPENPWLIRIIQDEIVSTGENEYLGKIHIKIYKNYYITLGYFGLSK
jgi:hypothetical protein